MKVSINLNTLKAVAFAASKEETRYYLQGVHLEAGPEGFTMVATNGHMLLCAFQPYGELMPQDHMANVIIPASLIAKLKVKRKADPWAELTIEGQDLRFDYMGETFGGKAIDGTFPAWRNVVPREVSGEIGNINPDLLATIQDAGRIFFEKPDALCKVSFNGDLAALVTFNPALPGKFFGVAMPFRGVKETFDHSWVFDASPIVKAA